MPAGKTGRSYPATSTSRSIQPTYNPQPSAVQYDGTMKKRAVTLDEPGPNAGASVEAISDRILGAIWEHRLPPATKLVEEKLASVFGVSRTKIRLALARLSHDGILTTEPNRGTFVSS